MLPPRVVITGMGAVAPGGHDVPAYWASLASGRSSVGAISLFDASRLPCSVAAEVRGFPVHEFLPPKTQRLGLRVVAFSLAAFRQAFAAGRDLSVPDNVLIAAAACELHPRAVLKGIESRSVHERLSVATEEAATRGVRRVPTVRLGTRLFEGEQRVEDAARAAAEGQACADQPLE